MSVLADRWHAWPAALCYWRWALRATWRRPLGTRVGRPTLAVSALIAHFRRTRLLLHLRCLPLFLLLLPSLVPLLRETLLATALLLPIQDVLGVPHQLVLHPLHHPQLILELLEPVLFGATLVVHPLQILQLVPEPQDVVRHVQIVHNVHCLCCVKRQPPLRPLWGWLLHAALSPLQHLRLLRNRCLPLPALCHAGDALYRHPNARAASVAVAREHHRMLLLVHLLLLLRLLT
mmetsp:Transcript_19839/g.53980  ORF Transcript_19839/g.53980 Transcript_19839/m.53980 type:complete len:233 (+) Transcript_19839:847-1545(+)